MTEARIRYVIIGMALMCAALLLIHGTFDHWRVIALFF